MHLPRVNSVNLGIQYCKFPTPPQRYLPLQWVSRRDSTHPRELRYRPETTPDILAERSRRRGWRPPDGWQRAGSGSDRLRLESLHDSSSTLACQWTTLINRNVTRSRYLLRHRPREREVKAPCNFYDRQFVWDAFYDSAIPFPQSQFYSLSRTLPVTLVGSK